MCVEAAGPAVPLLLSAAAVSFALMGPTLICDKSTLQGLGRSELNVLRRYYSLNIPPVLLVEILGDLKKHTESAMSREEVRSLAEKLVPACSTVNVDFRTLVKGELAGYALKMDGRPVIGGGKSVMDPDGKKGMVFEQTPESEALLRWQRGEFYEAETVLANLWRQSTQAIDLEMMQRELRAAYSPKIILRTLADTVHFVDELIKSAPPPLLIFWFLRDMDVTPARSSLERISALQSGDLAMRVPYTSHCIKLSLIFHFALAFGLIGTRPTNRVDLEYLFYSPFCNAFSSGDAFHRKIGPLVLRERQVLVDREELKEDLRRLTKWWAGLSDEQQRDESRRQGPPEDDLSVTHRLWSKLMKPGYRDFKKPLPAEISKKLLEELKKQAHDSVPAGQPITGSLDDCDFVMVKHQVRANGPCICGSDKLFKDCCGRDIVANS